MSTPHGGPDLVTGATGFIGKYLARRLLAQGRSVRILCREGSESKLPPGLRSRVEIVHVDLGRLNRPNELEVLRRACHGVQRVFHCAGNVSDWGPEKGFIALNADATRALLENSRAVRRFVHLSSIAAFGTPSPASFDDSSPLGNGRDPYSRTKAQGEKLVFDFHKKTGLPVTVIRPAVVYGLGGTWFEEPLRMIELGKMFLLGGGLGTCHPCYIENLIDAIVLAADHPRAIGQAYIVADDNPISFREYFNAIAEIADQSPITRSIPLPLARALATGFETTARIVRSSKRPLLTHAAINMVTTKSTMSMKKIQEELNFTSRYRFRQAMREIKEQVERRKKGFPSQRELAIPAGEFRAYLFDCDGTIADTMPLHYKAWLRALGPWNCDFPEDLFYAWAGRPGDRIVELLNEKYGLKMPPEKIFRSKEDHYLELLPEVRAIAEVKEQIETRHGQIPFAVVSGSPKASVLKTLEFLGLTDRFEAILGCEDYSHGKPHPEPFLAAASRLGVEPKHCLVFEDAELGIEAAQAAGMAWVKV